MPATALPEGSTKFSKAASQAMAASVEQAIDFPWDGTVFLAEGDGKW